MCFYGLLLLNPTQWRREKKSIVALAPPSFPSLLKYFAMSGKVGIEAKDF